MHATSETAMSHPETAASWRRRVRARWAWLAAVILCWAGAVAYSALPGQEGADPGVVVMVTIVALFAVPLTVTALVSAYRMGRILRAYPWQKHPCTFRRGSQVTVVVLRPEPGHEVPLQPTVFDTDLSRDRGSALESMWFAGDLRFGGVASPPGGHRVVRVARTNRAKAARSRKGASPAADALAEQVGLTRGRKVRSL
ncbi:hypothetical protein [Streptomyces poonensis]|uniref:Uncharacterized protein n=1 Tax=Streptomyces poonensis TaxID=68255 RepID=A0A918QC94_9ACTN|nr:hypothetical protein [Streptomyces poonensis]GGZ39114.1 hypothetical protein GCM10010365_69810 [Streptomyces poonensis]GLJ93127.1 hypothetical protein GCM10017589_57390 [Streptomyces poonensis]